MVETNEILKALNVIFKDVLENERIALEMVTTANEISEWDSLNHIQLVVAIEKFYKIRFSSKEIQNWGNISDIINSIKMLIY
jgi:acyl carrier protein